MYYLFIENKNKFFCGFNGNDVILSSCIWKAKKYKKINDVIPILDDILDLKKYNVILLKYSSFYEGRV